MAKVKNIRGKRYGKLVAMEPTDERRGGSVVWECKCDCGNIVFAASRDLYTGHNVSCGCAKRGVDAADITGQRFGKLVAVRLTEERRGDNAVWECKCDCGNIALATTHNLRAGYKTSCGCARRLKTSIDLTGQRFGRLVAVQPTDERQGTSVVWECKCDCGKITLVSANNLRYGSTKSCGCLRWNKGGSESITGNDTGG